MANIRINTADVIGRIKEVNGVGQPPAMGGLRYPLFHYLTEAGIPYSRLHDVGFYQGGRFVDIHCIFRNFDADPADPASYDFTFTDHLITALMEAECKPYFRLGVTIENFASVKRYNIFPPKDFAKWARICEGIIRHYTEGWADGFCYDIRYWEIWNEPDGGENSMWAGTKEQYYELYTVASKHLKACFPHLKIGGYASCGFYAETTENPSARQTYFVTFFHEFLAWIRREGAPLDFFSWHTYDRSIDSIRLQARYARRVLDEYGFTETETSCNEWNCAHQNIYRGTALHAALTAAVMLAFQEEPVDTAMFYDARLGPSEYGGLFNPLTWGPLPSYYSFMAFNELAKRGAQVRLEGADGLYAAAAADGETVAVMIVNPEGAPLPLSITGIGEVTECRVIDEARTWEVCDLPAEIGTNTVLCIIAKK
ncbi:MAG: hypothetical protein E7662_06200 [Ruminococcaceae bacterium]|nr:hypothetical protein [Oscillospiraceae bacterium]